VFGWGCIVGLLWVWLFTWICLYLLGVWMFGWLLVMLFVFLLVIRGCVWGWWGWCGVVCLG